MASVILRVANFGAGGVAVERDAGSGGGHPSAASMLHAMRRSSASVTDADSSVTIYLRVLAHSFDGRPAEPGRTSGTVPGRTVGEIRKTSAATTVLSPG
ncbi:MAG: hypothetical protein LBJ02_02000 [Bifidobacteriaceae bacterium]|nr:hypothetical protein [Bifidobacteriaceae bacterium]